MPEAADASAEELEGTAQGHAALLADGNTAGELTPFRVAADKAAGATLAIIAGRTALHRPA